MANQTARFFLDGGTSYVEIRSLGDSCTYIGKTTQEFVSMFPKEWEAHQSGQDNVDYGGRDLTEIPGFTQAMRLSYKLRGIHNLEMLAGASDAAVSSLGLGAITARKMAQLLLKEDPPVEPKRSSRPRKPVIVEDPVIYADGPTTEEIPVDEVPK